MVATLALISPAPYEANAGGISGTAPRGATSIVVRVDGRLWRVIRRSPRGTRFAIGPIGLPAGDHTVEVLAYHYRHLSARRTVRHVYGLPATAGAASDPRTLDRPLRRTFHALAGAAGGGVATGVWALDLGTGRAASWNAGASMPAASTLKLAILAATFVRDGGDPTRSPLFGTLERMVLDSSNRAANVLIDHAGGSWAINDLMSRLGATSTDMYGHYLLEPGERAEPDEPDAGFADGWWPDGPLPTARGREVPPADVSWQPSYATGKHTTAHDLGLLATAFVQATTGRGRLARLGVTRREARVGIWLLLHARYPGLVAPATGSPVAHKAGWLDRVQHDTAIVYRPTGPVVIALMTYRDGGVAYAGSLAWSTRVVRAALASLPRR